MGKKIFALLEKICTPERSDVPGPLIRLHIWYIFAMEEDKLQGKVSDICQLARAKVDKDNAVVITAFDFLMKSFWKISSEDRILVKEFAQSCLKVSQSVDVLDAAEEALMLMDMPKLENEDSDLIEKDPTASYLDAFVVKSLQDHSCQPYKVESDNYFAFKEKEGLKLDSYLTLKDNSSENIKSIEAKEVEEAYSKVIWSSEGRFQDVERQEKKPVKKSTSTKVSDLDFTDWNE